MQVFSAILNNVAAENGFRFHWKCKGVKLNHLTFADDVLLFCHGDWNSISKLLDGIDLFARLSGLSPNVAKSSFFFANVEDSVVQRALLRSGFQQGSLPIHYLGLPLISCRLTAQHCTTLVNKLCYRIESWLNRFLSFAGRMLLIKSILTSIIGYWSQYIFLPKGVLRKLQSILSKFLWCGNLQAKGHYKVSWSDCCLTHEEGGLGLRDLVSWNKAAIVYQLWRITHSNNSVWTSWFKCYVLKRSGLWTVKSSQWHSWCIRKILNHRDVARGFFHYEVGCNSNFALWLDPWPGSPLIDLLGPSIISICESTTLAKVNSMLIDSTWVMHPSNHVLAIELRHLLGQTIIHSADRITWDGQTNIKLANIWASFRDVKPVLGWADVVWHSWSIPKCSFTLWLAFKHRLLTKDRMIRFGLNVDPMCLLCSLHAETIPHLFSECNYSRTLLSHSPCSIAMNWSDFISGDVVNGCGSQYMKQLTHLFLSVTVFNIWKERNARLHNNGNALRPSSLVLADIMKCIREKVFSCKSFKAAAANDFGLISSLY